MKKLPKTKGENTPLGGPANNGIVAEFIREKLIQIMKKLQDMGVRSNQHVKRPYLFTGSWMEGVSTVEQLFDRVKDLSPNEIGLRLFNILYPYDKDIPKETGDEIYSSKFYGEYFRFDINADKDQDLRDSLLSKTALTNTEISKLNSTIDLYSSKIRKLEDDRQQLTTDVEDYKSQTYLLSSKLDDMNKLRESNADQVIRISSLEKNNKDLMAQASEFFNQKSTYELKMSTLETENKK